MATSTVRVYVSKDASVAQKPDGGSLGQGAGDNLVLGKQPSGASADLWKYRSFLQFPVDFTGMSSIDSVTLTLFAYNRSGQNNIDWEFTGSGTAPGMEIRRVTTSWSEGTKGADGIWWYNNAVAWDNQPSTTATNAVTVSSGISNTRPSHGKSYSFTITDIVKQWAPSATVTGGGDQANYGIRLAMRDETTAAAGGVEFCSREDNSINGGTSYDAYIDITYTVAASVVLPINAVSAPTASKVATIVNLNDTTDWTASTKLARPNLAWTFTQSTSTPAAQGQWRVRIYSAAVAGTTYFDSGWVTDATHATDTSVDIPLNIASATHMPGGLTSTISNVTWSTNTATYTTSAAHNLDTGMYVNVTGLNESALNISNTVITVTGSTTFTATTADPGTITGTSGTVSTIWYTGYKGLANNTTYYWTVQTRDVNGLEAAETSRTAFKVLFSNQQLQYAYPGGSASTFVHSIGATPTGTSVHRLYGTTNTTGATPTTWYSSLADAITNRGSNAYIVVAVRMGVLNNSNTAISDPTLSSIQLSYVATTGRVPDKWAIDTAAGSHTLALVSSSRRFGTNSARLTVNGTSGSIQAYRSSAGDGISVVQNTDYVFSAYVYDGDGVTGPVTLRIYAGSAASAAIAGETALATSDIHTAFAEDGEGWRRMYVFFNSAENTFVRPVVYCGSWTSGQAILLDGAIIEEGTVIRSYTPGLVNSPAVIEGGGIQVDASLGGTLRLRGSNGGTQDVIELGQYGLKFGPSATSAELYSKQSNELTVNGYLRSLRSATTDLGLAVALSSDTVSRGAIYADGKIEWGSGGSSSRDTNLYRSAADTLKTDDSLIVLGSLDLGNASDTTLTRSSAGVLAVEGVDVVTTSGTQTLTNKTLTDSTTTFADETDTTKKMQLQLSGITTATTRTLTVPNASGTIALTSDLTGTTFDLTGDVTVTAAAFTIGGANVYSVSVDNDSHSHTLGTTTSGNYVASLVAGTGVTLTNNTGAGATPTVAIGQAVATTSNVTFSNLTANGTSSLNGAVTLGNATTDVVRVLNIFQTTTITNSFNPRMYNASGTTPWRIFYDTSSERFKTNIVYMEDTDAILDVNPVSYHDKADYEANGEESPRQYGFLAEDMAANPEGIAFVVHNGADAETIQYERLVVPLFSAMRSLRTRIEELEAKIAELETGA